MDRKLEKYNQLLVQIFDEYAEILNRRPQPDRETELVIDPVRNQYALHTIGWQGDARIWNTPLYVRLQGFHQPAHVPPSAPRVMPPE